MPYLPKAYSNGGSVFMPDLAAAHYAYDTLQLLEELSIPCLAREENPPDVPQLCPIEDFLGLVKQEVYKNGWKGSSHDQLKRRIYRVIAALDEKVPRSMMRRVGERTHAAEGHGVNHGLH